MESKGADADDGVKRCYSTLGCCHVYLVVSTGVLPQGGLLWLVQICTGCSYVFKGVVMIMSINSRGGGSTCTRRLSGVSGEPSLFRRENFSYMLAAFLCTLIFVGVSTL